MEAERSIRKARTITPEREEGGSDHPSIAILIELCLFSFKNY